ncbi:Alpha/Beta hydrolase protein [Favolaschia claudopus]|uniref:Alpha/Beta hydrolase protein n=1 Tax=Favolaschia claudopus TaxID=2862362 RepID=A0AAV9ZVU1_9AGAR
MTETPFKISIPDAALELLQKKLELTTLPDELDGAGWDYGAPLADVKRLVSRWTNGYDWRHHEAQLNASLKQFTRPIAVDGHRTLNIHYVHQRSEVANAIPLLFVHGWPGSFIEARKILPLLTTKSANHPSFHVVTFSLPGYGFSEAASKPGFGIEQYAEVGHKLMLALGYNEYVTQGGDWGHAITRKIAQVYGGKYSKAWHTNMVMGQPPQGDAQTELTDKDKQLLARTEWFRKKGSGYMQEQSTQPQTLGYALTDSPVGLLAWIYEKLVNWTDNYPWDDDEVLTWISIYYFSRAGPAASLRIYYEAVGPHKAEGERGFVGGAAPEIPLGLSHFPQELVVLPRSWSRKLGNIVFEAEHDSGGHFAATLAHRNSKNRTMTETPFKISIPDSLLGRLKKKLELSTLPDELDGAGWDYGVPLADVKRFVSRWSNGYDWRYHEAQLNATLPQFIRPIDVDGHGTLNIHYVHQRSQVANAIPLLFVHGWPGSFIEARKILPLLTEKSGNHPSFHVVVLGLPGYGFSEGPSKPGFDIPQYAEVGNKLMLSLGYNEYVTQGGDWGHAITRKIAQVYGGKYSKAWHTNMVMGQPPEGDIQSEMTPQDKERLARTEWFDKKGSGYMQQSLSQPQTLGYALADSPVGLLAWIYEKLVNWTDSYPWEDDEVLTWVSIYYFSRAGPAASIRIYYEAIGPHKAQSERGFTSGPPPEIPLGLSHFPKDILVFPKSWSRKLGNIVFETEHESGGHFAAYEKPDELVEDLRKMFGQDGPAFGVVPGMSGYPVEK